jgi:anaerobic selenocysteine-containing dehydrogenase
MVHASQGVVESDTASMRSEPAIIAGIAQATLGEAPIQWLKVVEDYDLIRDLIAKTIPGFKGMNQGSKQDGGFYLGNTAAERVWTTPSNKAQFEGYELPESIISASQRALTNNHIFVLQTLRSHDQYNTTIYGFEDRYRGISGDRKIIMMHPQDIEDLGFKAEEKVDVEALWPDNIVRKVAAFQLIPYDTPRGNIAAYFPEANPLVALASYGQGSFTPTSKTIAVVITKHEEGQQEKII